MCDEATEAENEAYLSTLTKSRISRRAAGMGTGATLAAMLTGCAPPPAPAKQPGPAAAPTPPPTSGPPTSPANIQPSSEALAIPAAITAKMVSIEMPEGTAEAFFVMPKAGQHPGVLMWPDVAGLRDSYKTMATRLAEAGYAVLVVNQYYRSTKLPVLGSFAEWRTDQGKKRITPMREAITPQGVASDGAAFIAWLDQQEPVDKAKKLASCGYCMGGPFTFRTAAAVPERVGAIASFHGGGLVTDEPTSPHLLFPNMDAAALICIAQNDDEREPEAKAKLRQAAAAANVPVEVEVYPAQHGWCTIDSPVYDEAQAERAWARMLAVFERYL